METASITNKQDKHGTALTAVALPFKKMQACGNDFVLVLESDLLRATSHFEDFAQQQLNTSKIAQVLCNRHFGIGADGLIIVKAINKTAKQITWGFFNADGSTANMCGNGLRCLALWAIAEHLVEPPDFIVVTNAGPVAIKFQDQNNITVDFGMPILESNLIPLTGPRRSRVLKEPLAVADIKLEANCLSMGNPHCVIFNPPEHISELERYAQLIQEKPLFPQGVNVEFAFIQNKQSARVLVWERGVGATLACATGAAATLVAGVLTDLLERTANIHLPGGVLSVSWSKEDNHVRLTGPARFSFSGYVNLKQLLIESA